MVISLKTTIINANLITPNLEFRGGLVIDNDKIIRIFEGDKNPGEGDVFDAKGYRLAPGFVDIHLHGGGGSDFMDNDPDAYKKILQTHMRHGVTALCPTIMTSTQENIFASLSSYEIALAIEELPELLGLHIEGPYFSYEQKGAQDPRYIRNPDPAEYLKILDRSVHIKRWSMAPELDGALEFGAELRRRGIVAAIAHSDAFYEDVAKANDYGFTMLTHFYSGMSGVRRLNAYRYSGVIESGYLIDDYTVEIIADGHHLPESLLKLVYKQKGSSKICLVTDSMRAAGEPEGPSFLGMEGTGLPVIVEDGVAKLPDRSSFAGSVATADVLVRTMVKKAHVPINEAVRMMTLTPARVMGVDHRIGSIAVSKDADLVIFDDDINIKAVFIKGKPTVVNL